MASSENDFHSRSVSVSTPGGGAADNPADNPADTDQTTAHAKKASISSSVADLQDTSKKSTANKSDKNDKNKVTKRRAPRACVSCRARKVRCDVVEHFPCGNCRWDKVECKLSDNRRRRKKPLNTPASSAGPSVGMMPGAEALQHLHHEGAADGLGGPPSMTGALRRLSSVSMAGLESVRGMFGNAHAHGLPLLFQRPGFGTNAHPSQVPWNPVQLFGDSLNYRDEPAELDPQTLLPPWVKPLPDRIGHDEIHYLQRKGALSIPDWPLQEALLQAYVEYVHPYMPLLELFDFLNVINGDGDRNGQVSLLLYHAVLFAGSAFVNKRALAEHGYPNRKAARKTFFQRARLLYDFDYDSDRLVLVQALLLMTYWYETPDDQKDTWHWMGVAISLAHTIGLHRNPENGSMPENKQRLWKRIWWSCFMRDRLIALGMRRPTRIKDEDFDVPMLTEDDFEIQVLPIENTLLPPQCTLVRNVDMQRELAEMCVQKAKLCVLISHMLKAQYSVLIRDRLQPKRTNTTMMLFPNKSLDNLDAVEQVDQELRTWEATLPPSCQYRELVGADVEGGRSTIAVHRNLLHMVFHTTTSALHRPLFLPTSPLQPPQASRFVQEASRAKVKEAAAQITRMAAEMHRYRLDKYLPTTGVTVVLPAMIIHLVEYKNPDRERREQAQKGFHECMQVMVRLRDIYAAADFAAGFLEQALKKASIELTITGAATANAPNAANSVTAPVTTMPPAEMSVATTFTRPATPPPEETGHVVTVAETEESKFAYLAAAAAAPSTSPIMGGLPQQLPPHSAIIGDSPPHSEREIGLTPEGSGSDYASGDVEMTDMNGMDWSALGNASTVNLDFDAWLHFPGEGMNKTDDLKMLFNDSSTWPGDQSLENMFA